MSEMNSIFEKVFNKLKEEIKTNIKLLYIFKDFLNEMNVILVTNEDKVYCWGSNYYGVLGFVHTNIVNEFTINEELSNKRIIDFKTSKFHTIARDSNGKLYCWGNNIFGCLGNGRVDEDIYKPELNKYLINENIIDMCCGDSHTLVLNSNKEVYGWGWNRRGQIRNICDGNNVSIPFKINEFNNEKVEAISCGYYHSMALTESGCVYSWGDNDWGQLGLNKGNKNEKKPERIEIDVKFKKICCGRVHSLLLSREGDIYVFGRNDYRQLGIETEGKKQLNPIKLNHSEKFIEIASHFNYNISSALSEKEGLTYVWGECGERMVNSELVKKQFVCFEDMFMDILGITAKSIQCLSHFENNRKYTENWTEIIEIGKGSYGTVFKVENKIFKETIFAIKKFPLEEKKENNSVKELLNSKIILEFNSDHLVKYYDVWYENDFKLINGFREYTENKYTIYIQMDLCDKTLSVIQEEIKEDSELFSNNSLTHLGYYFLSELFVEILEGVKYLHKKKIIHRDLNPHNILVKRGLNGNCIKIADFGLAEVHDNNKLHTKDRGHVRYQAPEVQCSEKYDMSADIYSLGVILKELFAISFNNEYRNNSSDMTSKYECLEKVYEKMGQPNPKNRPDCQQMLEERESWTLNENEFNFIEELNILLDIIEENRSYVQNIIVSKLFKNNLQFECCLQQHKQQTAM